MTYHVARARPVTHELPQRWGRAIYCVLEAGVPVFCRRRNRVLCTQYCWPRTVCCKRSTPYRVRRVLCTSRTEYVGVEYCVLRTVGRVRSTVYCRRSTEHCVLRNVYAVQALDQRSDRVKSKSISPVRSTGYLVLCTYCVHSISVQGRGNDSLACVFHAGTHGKKRPSNGFRDVMAQRICPVELVWPALLQQVHSNKSNMCSSLSSVGGEISVISSASNIVAYER